MSRQEKRRELKKQKRKQQRQQAALWSAQAQAAEAEEVVDAEVDEEEALAKERAEHEEQERLWLLREEEAQREWLRKQAEKEAQRTRKEEERRLRGEEDGEEDLEEGWEYVEDGPAEIIWQGNEIIVKKPRKKVRKGTLLGTLAIEDKKRDGPISNPLPPQSAAFSSYQADIQDVADPSTNFGTEKDQRNCPFYIKTGVCRFGVRCSRLHPVFNAACTLLMRSMYTGAGLALEPVESLEYTDEEVIQDYEEFYDDVHSEFIRFGEIVNFKVCRNSSPHLRGNVYVHYVSQESAMAAYNHMNGRFYAKKQISCEFVGVHKWKLAICGEFMRTYYKTCSHGTACNFLHCFENPRREYEWADMDRPPPRFWQRKMAKLFGHGHVLDDKDADEKQEKAATRAYRESSYRRRDTGHRELMYDDGHSRRDRRIRDSASCEDDHRRGRGDRERKHHEEETKSRSRRGSSKKYDDDHQQRRRHSSHDSHRREEDVRDFPYYDDDDDDLAWDKSASACASRSMHGDEPGSINDERWTGGDDHLETDVSHHRERCHRSTTYYELDDDDHSSHHPGTRYFPNADHVSHHSYRHRAWIRSRSPGSSHRSQDRPPLHPARNQDGYYYYHSSSEEQEDRHAKEARHKEGKKVRHRHGTSQSGGDIPHDGHDMLGRRGDEVVGKKSYFESEYPHQEASSNVPASDGIRSQALEGTVVAGMVSDENGGGGTGLSLDLLPDDVQKSTLGWQSWRKSKKVKLGLTEKPMRVII